MSRRVAVVGAGGAGAAAAYALRDAPVDVTVFERGERVGGRASTDSRDGCVVEHGANYLTDADERVAEVVTGQLSTDGLVEIDDPVWTFDRTGRVSEGDDVDERRWTYEGGLVELSRRLLAAGQPTVHREVGVDAFQRDDEGWRVLDASGEGRGRFDALVLTPPAPRTADLLGRAAWEHRDCRRLRRAIAPVPFRTVVSVALYYAVDLDRPYYALVDVDDDHEVGWIAREECKPGHVPAGECLLLVQMAPDWSVEHFHDRDEAVAAAAAERAAALLDDDRLAEPDWSVVERWRCALPDEGVDEATMDTAARHGLFLAGDWVAGEARLHAAVGSGLAAGERVREQLA